VGDVCDQGRTRRLREVNSLASEALASPTSMAWTSSALERSGTNDPDGGDLPAISWEQRGGFRSESEGEYARATER
jgi:hypothetical protein